jgi:hypothetical protein
MGNLNKVQATRLYPDLQGVRPALWLPTHANKPAMQIAYKSKVGICELFCTEIVPNITDRNTPLFRQLDSTPHIDGMCCNDCRIQSAVSHQPKVVIKAEIVK